MSSGPTSATFRIVEADAPQDGSAASPPEPLALDPALEGEGATGEGIAMEFFPFAGARAAHGGVRRALERGVGTVLLQGPDGIGKTRLLTDLSQRLQRRFQVIHLPLAALPTAELLSWALGALRIELKNDPAHQLLEHAANEGTLPIVLTIDEAQLMPVATARALAELVERARGRIHVVLAMSPDERAPRVRACFGSDVDDVAFERALNADEAHAFLRALIESRGGLPTQHALLDESTVAALYTTSGGLPGRLAELALGLLPTGASRVQASPLPLASDADPFAVASRADGYVPRPATEAALEELHGRLQDGASWLALVGPPGLGKTQTLHVLGNRLGDRFHPLHVGYGSLEPEELERWIATLLGAPAGASSLLTTAREFAAAGTPLVLLADDATSIPTTSQRWLRDQVVAAEGALRVVLAATDDGRGRPLADLDGEQPALVRIALTDPLDAEETEALVAARLSSAAAPEPMRRAFNARSVRELHEEAAGNPAELERLADARVRNMAPPSTAPPPRASTRPRGPAPRPAAFDPRDVENPSWLSGARGWSLLAAASLVTLAVFLVPALTSRERIRPAMEDVAAPTPSVRVHINATPWAEVTIDGQELGVTPLGNVELTVGTHQLQARMPDGSQVEREIFVDEGRRHIVVNP